MQMELEALQIWGGAEYTCNRVGDRYIDQMELSGHAHRPQDYSRFADLGLTSLRIGLLWERYESASSWKWTDEHVRGASKAQLEVIAGLVHHGSGPAHTDLLDSRFPQMLAAYAGSLARRYPDIAKYTPVNEPYTTARFSGMYGLWYPHQMSRSSLFRALIHQLKATVLCMEAIRQVRNDAQLIQTDDFGRVSGTEMLRPVWENLNQRRWLAIDLLCGKVDSGHSLFRELLSAGISENEIGWFAEHPCPPDVIGINFYPTSDRYLDHQVDSYPEECRSAEGTFVDVEAVRSENAPVLGLGDLIVEAWDRYRIPVAITEVHIGGEVNEQIRWAASIYESVLSARSQGAQCIAMTFWALLGSFYWNQLVTRENGYYEPGVFDTRSGIPVESELGIVVRQIAKGLAPSHQALQRSGWWLHKDRICYPPMANERVPS
ncbi:dTDP-4-dehydrorhamnose reductase [Silvibacterium bohemicum]|uniref:dTDP-4-dehydrorhamnose reductase n=1 Tax=Silvibacterium bohemicum TaxID=1577686 RepID=A0A841JTQ6_9BACT|nr:glycoside hydrolase [Silvibacterium bohemicum]MBB6144540.1 dTDP-4-dehydrorhamnose reductase [Silvibacterium bohemicum]